MHLSRLSIFGFMGFSGVATLALDDIAPGVVAVIGPNGEGKTRLMDAAPASVYGPGALAAFPSREGTLADYATSRKAVLESEWVREDGARLRATVGVDGKARATEAWLLRDGAPLNDGKVTTFREVVAAQFPSRRQLLASAFAAQGRQGSFVGLDQTGRNALLAELLDLGHYARLSETAKRCAAAAEKVHLQAQAQRVALSLQATPEALAAAQQAVDAAAAGLQAATQRLTAAQADVARLETDRARHAPLVAKREAVLTRLSALRQDAERCDRDLSGVLAARSAAETAAAAATADAERAYAVIAARADSATAEAERRFNEVSFVVAEAIEAQDALLEKAEAIKAALADRVRVEHDIEEALLEHNTALDELLKARNGLEKARTAAAELKDARRQAAALSEAPFGEKCAPCAFMKDAADAVPRIPQLEQIAGPLDDWRKEAADFDAEVTAIQQKLTALRASLKAEPVASAPQLSAQLAVAAEKRAALVQRRIDAAAALEREGKASAKAVVDARVDRDRRKAAAAEQLGTAVADLGGRDVALRAELVDIQAHQRAALRAEAETAGVADLLSGVETDLAHARTEASSCASGVASYERDGLWARKALADLQEAMQRHDALQPRLTAIEDEWLTWRLLAQACGRDGVPRLEIDAAGPTVAGLCNDLLASAFSSRFSIDLTTQVPLADGKGWKEEVAVRVLDQRHGGATRDLTDLSGGERVVVEEALRSAIALFVNARGRQPVRTLWRDETTGALDPENVPRYVAMLRRLRQVGGIRHVLFVTHSEAAAALADAVVRVAGGVPTVERVA